MGEGIIEMKHELDHAFAAGYEGARALRTWQERMKSLEDLGLIKTKQVGNERYKHVALVHPNVVLEKLAGVNYFLPWTTTRSTDPS